MERDKTGCSDRIQPDKEIRKAGCFYRIKPETFIIQKEKYPNETGHRDRRIPEIKTFAKPETLPDTKNRKTGLNRKSNRSENPVKESLSSSSSISSKASSQD